MQRLEFVHGLPKTHLDSNQSFIDGYHALVAYDSSMHACPAILLKRPTQETNLVLDP